MIKHINTTLIVFILLVASCTHDRSVSNLCDDLYLPKYFSNHELAELERVIAFVDSCVLARNKYEDLNAAYYHAIDSVWYYSSGENGMGSIPIDEKKKYQFLSTLDTNLFNKIWQKSSIRRISSRDTTILFPVGLYTLSVPPNCLYAEMLNELGVDDDYFKIVSNGIQSMGDISPAVVAMTIGEVREMDFEKAQYRLWAAVFLISREESAQVRVERYLKEITSNSDF